MMIGIAKAVVGHHDPFGDMGQFVFLRHRDAPVHLDRIFGHQTARAAHQA